MTELKYTAKDIDNLIAEQKTFKGDLHDFIRYKCDPIISVLNTTKSNEEWDSNWNKGSKKLQETGRYCTCCGRPVNDRVMFHMVTGGNSMGSKKDNLIFTLFDDSDMYMYEIGSSCAKKMTKEILKPLGLNPRDYFYGVDYVAKYESNPDYLDIDDLPNGYKPVYCS